MNVKVTPPVFRKIVSARKRGLSLRAIAAKVAVSHETVRSTLADAARGKGKA